jgi:hypothetical protein
MTMKWSNKVTKESHALNLEEGVFSWKDPLKIAESLKRSAEVSRNRKSSPLKTAMSMLSFYVNRAGKNLSPDQRKTLYEAKEELRKLFRQSP